MRTLKRVGFWLMASGLLGFGGCLVPVAGLYLLCQSGALDNVNSIQDILNLLGLSGLQ